MVLGANIKSMKTSEIQYMTKGSKTSEAKITNPLFEGSIPEENAVVKQEAESSEDFDHFEIDSYKPFKMTIDRFAKDRDFRLKHMGTFLTKSKDEKAINRIVSIDFDAKYFVTLARLISDENELLETINKDLVEFIEAVSKTKNFTMMIKKMLSKSEKMVVKTLLTKSQDLTRDPAVIKSIALLIPIFA